MTRDFEIGSILTAIQSVIPPGRKDYNLHEPDFNGREWEYVKECLDTGWVSSAGRFVDMFEEKLAEYAGVKRAVAVMNGTAALHICLKLAGVKDNDEVIIPSFTFVATANAVAYCNAVPHFADISEKTLGIDPEKLSSHLKEMAKQTPEGIVNKFTGRSIRAVMPMHAFGHPCDIDALKEVCSRFGLALIEDAAESLGSFYKGKHTGSTGLLSALSFNGNKIVTTGGGGAILTNDEVLGKTAKHITTTAKLPHKWAFVHDRIGYNYRMPNINAALGCAQLEQMPEKLKLKRGLAARYAEAFNGVAGVTFFTEPENARSNYWLNAFLLDRGFEKEKDRLLGFLHDNGIMSRPAWTPMHRLEIYSNCPAMDLKTTEDIEARLVNIPSSANLGAVHAA